MNEFDSERIAFLLEKEGYLKTGTPQDANIIIINTCAVRKKAVTKLFGHIGNLKTLKTSNPDLIICVGGCAAQNLENSIIEKFPFIDIIFGTKNSAKLPYLIRQIRDTKKNVDRICDTGEENITSENLFNFKRHYEFKAFLPIMTGCNNFCSYCIVPFVRGREVSFDSHDIINAARRLVKSGVEELTLLGQNVNSYGNNMMMAGSEQVYFANLLENIASIDNLKRIRFMTSHPKDFSDNLINVIRKYKNIMKHIHLPIQAGSDKILHMMNRKYTSSDYIDLFYKIKSAIPDCSITTDIIVGFPGEDENDFNRTLEIVSKLRFNRAFTFLYSTRTGTPAEKIPDRVPLSEKKKWFSLLVELQNRISLEENSRLLNGTFEVLVEGFASRGMGLLEGRLENNMIANFTGDDKIIGKLINIEITNARSFYLEGRIAENCNRTSAR
jgi:tRNA-2-methylthio-N6-dimethylallyladenosine synthase